VEKNGNSNLACTYRNHCDCLCRLEAFKIRSVDSAYCHSYCTYPYWIGLHNRFVFSVHLTHNCNKEIFFNSFRSFTYADTDIRTNKIKPKCGNEIYVTRENRLPYTFPFFLENIQIST